MLYRFGSRLCRHPPTAMAGPLQALRDTGLDVADCAQCFLLQWPGEIRSEPFTAELGAPAPREEAFETGSVWSKYGSIASCDRRKAVDEMLALAEVEECEWIASEKVHGANFSFETDGQDVEYACRTCRLGNGADFYNARTTMPTYHPFVLEAFRLAKQRFHMLRSLLIYGEYFGGYYPGHPGEAGLKKVQGGVAYSPNHHFYAFDVSLNGETYLDFDDARELLLAAGFPLVAAPLHRGPLREMLAIDVETLETSIPAQLGHPPLNCFRVAEGLVLRPTRELRLKHGRAMLKKKARAFWEATNQFGMAAKVAVGGAGPSSAMEVLTEVAKSLVTENRLRAVISKDPQLLGEGQVHKLAGLFAKDVFDELETQRTEELNALGKGIAPVRKAIQHVTRAFVSKHVAAIRADVG